MNFLSQIFNVVLYQPLFNALIFLYQILPGQDFGIAIIVLTILIRLALFPLTTQSLKSQKALSQLQEKVKEIQQRNKGNQEKQAQEILELYQKENINPLSSLTPLLIQLPLLIALYRVFWRGLKLEELAILYSFVPAPEIISFTFLNTIDLSQPNFSLAIMAGFFQLVQSKTLNPKTKKNSNQVVGKISDQMLFMFPVLTVFILNQMPAAVGLYWIITTLFSIIQQRFILKS